MARTAVKTIRIEASNTWSVWDDGSKQSLSGGPDHTVGKDGTDIYYAAYDFDFSAASIVDYLNVPTSDLYVESVYLEYYYKEAGETNGEVRVIDYVQIYPNNIPDLATASARYTSIESGDYYKRERILNEEKTLCSSLIGITRGSDTCHDVLSALQNEDRLSIGLRRFPDIDSTGYMKVGGLTMKNKVGTAWEAASGNESAGRPALIIELREEEKSHILFDMRYTTLSPDSEPDSTEENSFLTIGGYFSSNNAFYRVQVHQPSDADDTTIQIASNADMPDKTDVYLAIDDDARTLDNLIHNVQVGPEILKLGAIDNDNNWLTGCTRGVIPPNYSSPISTDRFAEYVTYLYNWRLFDVRPTETLTQYRCLAIYHYSGSDAEDVEVYLVQNPDLDTQVDIGIEVPAWDTREVNMTAGGMAGESTIFESTSPMVASKEEGFFDGAFIVIDPAGTAFEAFVESFSSTGGTAEFIIDRSAPIGGFAGSTTVRIYAGPSQRVSNGETAPVENSGRFFGFFESGGSNLLSYGGVRENGGTLTQHDVFYIWVKRTLTKNVQSKSDGGAIILLKYTDTTAIGS